jgi:hypothetical protein
MNQAPPIRLHWIPVCPSWIVSAGIVLLAVLPHKIPVTGRRVLGHVTTRLLFAAAAIYVWLLKPVLGTAMLILLASLVMMPEAEADRSPVNQLSHVTTAAAAENAEDESFDERDSYSFGFSIDESESDLLPGIYLLPGILYGASMALMFLVAQ